MLRPVVHGPVEGDMTLGQNLLVWLLIIACLVAGFEGDPPVIVLVLGATGAGIYFIIKPGPLSLGWKERGLSYLATVYIGSAAICAGLFFLGAALRAIAQ